MDGISPYRFGREASICRISLLLAALCFSFSAFGILGLTRALGMLKKRIPSAVCRLIFILLVCFWPVPNYLFMLWLFEIQSSMK